MSADTGHRFLVELTAPPEDADDEFNAWYDGARLPRRRALEGVERAWRFQDTRNPSAWAAFYDLATPGILPESRDELPEEDAAMEARLARLENREYVEIPIADEHYRPLPETPYLVQAVWWTPSADQLDDFHAWYAEEHIPLLLEVPGWLAIRRYRLVEGTGPAFLAIHYIASDDVVNGPSHRRAADTPWRAKAASHRIQHERRLFKAHNA